MNPLVKDYVQSIFWVVGILGGLATAWVAITQLKASTKQRERELRFQQANAGKKLLEELFEDEGASWALDILDFGYQSFTTETGEKVCVRSQEIPVALEAAFEEEDVRTIFIAKSFDALFYYLSSIEHFIEIGLTTEQDVKYPMDYYTTRLAETKSVYEGYINRTTYHKALNFLNRFESWSNTIG